MTDGSDLAARSADRPGSGSVLAGAGKGTVNGVITVGRDQAQPLPAAEVKPPTSRRRRIWILAALIVALVVMLVASVALGTRPVSLSSVWDGLFHYNDSVVDQIVVRHLRVPRTILGLMVGVALGLAGALMQALTRNPLADPGILGVNSGAALAIVVAIAYLHVSSLTGYVWFGMAGAAIASALVYLLGSIGRASASPVRLALAGTAFAAVFTGIISGIVLLKTDAFEGFRTWSVGSLSGRLSDVVWQALPFCAIGTAIALGMGRALNTLALGDSAAAALGAKVSHIRLTGFLVVTLLCGTATAAVGPIAFVGLVVPHVARMITGPDYRWLLPYCLLISPILLLGADILGRVLVRPAELQVSVVVAFLGAPGFIMLVRRRRLMQL